MFYVYRKNDGSILSSSRTQSIISATPEIGIVELSTALPSRELVNYVVSKGSLKRRSSESRVRAQKLRVESRTKQAIEAKKKFWELLEPKAPSSEDLKEALQLLGAVVFPRGKV